MSFWGRQLIAKKNTWFEYGKQVFVVDDYGDGLGPKWWNWQTHAV